MKKICGGCLCERVRFEVDGPFVRASHCHCRSCGSSLFGGDWPNGVEISIRFGAFDEDPGIRPEYHSFVDSRAAWDKIQDDLPQYPASPPRFRPSLAE